jgi:hypothetical protein
MCHTVAEKVTARKKSPVFALLLSLFHGGEVFVESEVKLPQTEARRWETALKLLGGLVELSASSTRAWRSCWINTFEQSSRLPHQHLLISLKAFEIASQASW